MNFRGFKLSSNRGFTLVELMVVVAVIGVLAAVAIPNFRKYQAKSKTAEAKLQLAALYSAEVAAYADYNSYVSCLNIIGYDPASAFTSRYYAVGFPAAGSGDGSAVTNGLSSTCTTSPAWAGTATSSTSQGRFGFGAGRQVGGASTDLLAEFNGSHFTTTPNATASGFLAGAAGIVASGGGNDAWTIDENKNIAHPTIGY